jgi:hypothetical protein
MLEKFESLHLAGFESIKYLEEQAMSKDKNIPSETLDKIRFMSVEEWEKSLTDKDRGKIFKRTQDQRKVLRRILETDLGLVEEQELYNEIKYHKTSKSSTKFMPSLNMTKSISAPDLSMRFGSTPPNLGNTPSYPPPFNYNTNVPTPALRRPTPNFTPPDSTYRPATDYDTSDPYPTYARDSNFEFKPFSHKFAPANYQLEECSYTIDRTKMNEVADNIDQYLGELPSSIKYSEIGIDLDTEKLKDSTYYSQRDRHADSPRYNYGLLNELQNKIKTSDDYSVEDLKLIIFLIQRTISDMKNVGRGGRGYSLSAYELRRRGFEVNPKELLDLLKRL